MTDSAESVEIFFCLSSDSGSFSGSFSASFDFLRFGVAFSFFGVFFGFFDFGSVVSAGFNSGFGRVAERRGLFEGGGVSGVDSFSGNFIGPRGKLQKCARKLKTRLCALPSLALKRKMTNTARGKGKF